MKKSLAPFVIIILLAIMAVIIYTCIPKPGKLNAIAGLEEPVQTELKKTDETGTSFKKAGYDVKVTYLYKYDVDALVVSAHDYTGIGLQDQLSPKDLALAWGKIAETNTLIDYQWHQSNRFVFWQVDSGDLLASVGGVEGVTMGCSNNHIIPADSVVKSQLKKVRKGDHIRLHGYLVSLEGSKSNGATFTWHSSTSRTDDGNGACEVIYTTGIEIVE